MVKVVSGKLEVVSSCKSIQEFKQEAMHPFPPGSRASSESQGYTESPCTKHAVYIYTVTYHGK